MISRRAVMSMWIRINMNQMMLIKPGSMPIQEMVFVSCSRVLRRITNVE